MTKFLNSSEIITTEFAQIEKIQDYLDIWNWYRLIKYFVICVFKNLDKVLFIRKHSKF